MKFDMELYEWQKDAIKRMKNGCILCGGVGSGKSITAIEYYYSQYGGWVDRDTFIEMKNPVDLYIITTAHKRDTREWEKELSIFSLYPDKEFNTYKINVVVDSWNNIEKYVAVSGCFFIFDEQRVVGYGKWSKSFIKISQRNKWILLSATPGDTWSDYIPVFIANGFYKNKTEFNKEHVVYSSFSKFPKIDRYLNTMRLSRLRDSILVNMDFIRPTKSFHTYVECEYDKELYRKVVKDRWNIFTDEPIVNASEFCLCLRKIVNSDVSRQVKILEICEKTPKAIIFYSFDYELEILLGLGYPEGTEVAQWNGHKHQPIPESERWVYLVQYTAGAEGWNCIKTDTIIFYSQQYSYKILTQSCGRIDRLNTPFTNLYYYHLRSSAVIDRAISRAIRCKKDFNAGSFGNSLLK